jgi:hypothetical protein
VISNGFEKESIFEKSVMSEGSAISNSSGIDKKYLSKISSISSVWIDDEVSPASYLLSYR